MSRVLSLWTGMTGTVFPFAGTTAPADWLMCYWQAVSRTTYATLFKVIGTTYGAGDGSTTFNVPDLRGRIAAGKDNMGGTAAGRLTTAAGGVNGAALGAAGGTSTHTLTDAQIPAHTHTGTTATAGAHTHTATTAADGGHTHTGSTGSAGAHTHGIPARGSDGSATNDTTTLMYGTTKTEGTFTSMASAGAHTHTVSIAAAADHTHTVSVASATGHTHTVDIAATGGDTAHPNVQPTIVLNHIIKI